jgi:hypothetical protein
MNGKRVDDVAPQKPIEHAHPCFSIVAMLMALFCGSIFLPCALSSQIFAAAAGWVEISMTQMMLIVSRLPLPLCFALCALCDAAGMRSRVACAPAQTACFGRMPLLLAACWQKICRSLLHVRSRRHATHPAPTRPFGCCYQRFPCGTVPCGQQGVALTSVLGMSSRQDALGRQFHGGGSGQLAQAVCTARPRPHPSTKVGELRNSENHCHVVHPP